jgi:thiosulfate/3-mercaptopyruvate sulfurtransferase
MGKKLIVPALFVGVLFFASVSLVSAAEYPGPLVSMDWVQQNLDTIKDPNQTEIRLVEVSKKGYDKEHIPGAVHVKWSSEVFPPHTNRMILGLAEMQAVMKKLGVTPDTHIVIYADSLTQATRFYWTLKYWKVEKISIMDGTKKLWKEEGRPLTADVPAVKKLDYPVKYPPNGKIYAVKEFDVMRGLATGKVVFVDTRPKAYYDGEKFSLSKWVRSGHLPGAIQWSAPEEVSEAKKKFLSTEELKKMAEEKGLTPDKEIIVYCNTGVRSSMTWFILSELLGYPKVKNYDGSLREWANELYLPMEPDNFNVHKNFPKTPVQEVKEAAESNAEKIAELEKELAEVKKAAGKGVCGPTALLALAMLPLGIRRLLKKQ